MPAQKDAKKVYWRIFECEWLVSYGWSDRQLFFSRDTTSSHASGSHGFAAKYTLHAATSLTSSSKPLHPIVLRSESWVHSVPSAFPSASPLLSHVPRASLNVSFENTMISAAPCDTFPATCLPVPFGHGSLVSANLQLATSLLHHRATGLRSPSISGVYTSTSSPSLKSHTRS